MRILKVWDGEYPWDVRAEKVCQALTFGGHDVHMVARNRDGRIHREELPECTVHRLRPWTFAGRALDAASQFPAFFNPRWILIALRTAEREGCEAIVVRDLPLAPSAVFVGNLLGIPVVLDMAENYPAMIRDLWTTNSTKFGDGIVRNPAAVEAIERWTVKRVDHIVVVVEESRDRLVEVLGVDPRRITVVGNTPSIDRLAAAGPRAAEGAASAGAPLEMIYLGLLEHARGVGTAIDAVAICRDRGVPVRFTIIGDGRARADFEAQRAQLRLGDEAVRLLGFLPYTQALPLLQQADVGVIPHFANESWHTTIPNKLFDYMAAGICVITSDARPARRVVEETGSGRAFASGDAVSFAGAIEAIWRAGSAREHGAAGRRAVADRYHWEKDRDRLLAVMSGLQSA